MKKITFLMALLICSIGFSQDLLLGFEAGESGGVDGATFGNMPAPTVVTGTGSNMSQVLEIVGNTSGEPWQGVNINLTTDVDLTSTQTMTIDVKSATAITFLVKVNDGSGPEAAAEVTHNGDNTWQTLSFTFNTSLDGKAAMANGEYNGFVIHAYWEAGQTTFFPGGTPIATPARTFYVDNISGPASTNTCSNGIQDGDETGVDCGGSCDPCTDPATAAPNPTTPDNQVLSLYGDTGGFTNIWSSDYTFGTNQGEVDLGSGTTNNALKMDFSVAGWGAGTNSPVDITEYEWLHFDYYVPDITPGSSGHQVKFILIGQGQGEFDYVISPAGGDATIVLDSWQSMDIPLSHYTGLGMSKNLWLQYKLGTDSDLYTTVAYFDNIYFWSNEALSTKELSKSAFKIYPNPTQDSWNIKTENTKINSIKVFDVLGKSVMTLSPNKIEATIDGSSLVKGLYFATIETDSGSNSIKLVKE